MLRAKASLVLVAAWCGLGCADNDTTLKVDEATSTFRDAANRTRLFHGTNFVQKSAPFYPTIADADIELLAKLGLNVVRLGVMMPGVFPTSLEPDQTYLTKIVSIIDALWAKGISVVVDLHQDVLGPRICGEGTPDWMLNVSTLNALPFPEPLTFNGSKLIHPDARSGAYPNITCGAVGPLSFIGWSELYMTDASGKAFAQIYDGQGVLGRAFEAYWTVVSKLLARHPGVIAYEVLNEPWLGDHVGQPALLAEAGAAEARAVGPFMQRMHDLIRANDPLTPVMYAPAELNNRLMRSVGYADGFLRGEPMAFHAYCITGTDGDGPTTAVTKALCHANDGLQLGTREKDLRRLHTAGFVTEFGGVSDSDTGRAEVRFVAEKLDQASPPLSWIFWAGLPAGVEYQKELGRAYPRAVAGELLGFSFDAASALLTMQFVPDCAAAFPTEVVLPALHFPDGWLGSTVPVGACSLTQTDFGAQVACSQQESITLTVKPK